MLSIRSFIKKIRPRLNSESAARVQEIIDLESKVELIHIRDTYKRFFGTQICINYGNNSSSPCEPTSEPPPWLLAIK
jgi:hypothetical protein